MFFIRWTMKELADTQTGFSVASFSPLSVIQYTITPLLMRS